VADERLPLQIIRATPELAGELTRIAVAAKRYWRYPESWIRIWMPILTITGEYLAANPTFAAWPPATERPAGFYSLIVSGLPVVWLDHLWLDPDWIGRGLGRTLFEHATATAAALGGALLEIEAEPLAEPFYRHMGARRVGERIGEIESQPRILPLMELALPAGRPAGAGSP
jgi:GNAT superfamily N-acetyltransferase